MPVYLRCVNPDCGWKGSCREFCSLKEPINPSHIPPNAKCACGCFRAQHELEQASVRPSTALGPSFSFNDIPTKDNNRSSTNPEAATRTALPSATRSSTQPIPSPLHPFINRFTSAAAAAVPTTKERLDMLNQQRVQTTVRLTDFLH